MFQITCCLDCKERTIKCHDSCERYLAERDEFKKAKQFLRDKDHVDIGTAGLESKTRQYQNIAKRKNAKITVKQH